MKGHEGCDEALRSSRCEMNSSHAPRQSSGFLSLGGFFFVLTFTYCRLLGVVHWLTALPIVLLQSVCLGRLKMFYFAGWREEEEGFGFRAQERASVRRGNQRLTEEGTESVT